MKLHFAVTHTIRRTEMPTKNASPYIFVKTQHAYVLVYKGYVKFLLFSVKLCIGGLRQASVS
jgi:hypothetical protein